MMQLFGTVALFGLIAILMTTLLSAQKTSQAPVDPGPRKTCRPRPHDAYAEGT